MPNSDHKEPTDLFERKPPHSIPTVPKVTLPPEEQHRQRIRWAAISIVAALMFVTAVVLGKAVINQKRLQSAIGKATDDGSPSQVAYAMKMIGDASPHIRARLHAAAALAGDKEALQEANTLLGTLQESNDADTQVARLLVALAEGDVAKARSLALPGTYDQQAAEFLRARSMTTLGHGEVGIALADTTEAVALRPDAPRVLAAHAITTARAKGALEGVAVLESAARSGVVRATRARLLSQINPADPNALEEAKAAIESDDIMPADKAWAQVALSSIAFAKGALFESSNHAKSAAATAQNNDEQLLLSVAQRLLFLNETAAAESALRKLSSGPSVNPTERGLTLAWLQLQNRNRSSAKKMIKAAKIDLGAAAADNGLGSLVAGEFDSGSPRTAERQRAVERYALAAVDPVVGVYASARRASALRKLAKHDEARSVANKALNASPDHPLLVDQLVQVQMAMTDSGAALNALNKSIKAHAEEPTLHANRGHVLLTRGEHLEAAKSFDKAFSLAATESNYVAMRGEAQRLAGDANAAKTSFDKALSLDSKAPEALVGNLRIAVAAVDRTAAEAAMKAIADAKLPSRSIDLDRAQYDVLRGAGSSALRTTRGAILRNKKNSALRFAGGNLALQSEQYPQAVGFFNAFRRAGGDKVTRYIHVALTRSYGRRFRDAQKALNSAVEIGEAFSPENQSLFDVVKGHIQLMQNNRIAAQRLAKSALQNSRKNAHAHLLAADALGKNKKSEIVAHLRSATTAPVPVTLASAKLALRLGANAEGCTLASQYLKAAPRGSLVDRIKRLREHCK